MKKYINQYRTETIRGENNKKIRNVIYTGDYYKITKEKTARKVFFIDMLPSYRTMKYKSPMWGYFHV